MPNSLILTSSDSLVSPKAPWNGFAVDLRYYSLFVVFEHTLLERLGGSMTEERNHREWHVVTRIWAVLSSKPPYNDEEPKDECEKNNVP